MSRIVQGLRDWPTTITGVLSAFFGFVLFSPETFHGMPWLVELAKYAFFGGLAALGILVPRAQKG